MSDSLDWNDLQVFLAIARRGSLGAASRHLKQSQPTMGRRLKALETALGRTLFQRTARGLVPTEEGTRLLGRAETIEREVQGIRRQVATTELRGTVRVGSSEWFGTYVLAPVLAEFAQAHPGITMELLTDFRLPSLDRRDLDLAFRIVPFEEPNVITRRLLTMTYGVYIAKHLEPPVNGNTTLGLITLTAQFDHIPDGAWLRSRLPGSETVFRSNNREVQARMCALGRGVAVLPTPLGDAFPELTRIDLGEEPPTRDTWLGYHRDQGDSPIIRSLVDLAVRRLAR